MVSLGSQLPPRRALPGAAAAAGREVAT